MIVALNAAHEDVTLKLAALRTFGVARTNDYPAGFAWDPQEASDRASQADISNVLRAHFGSPSCRRRPKDQR